MHGSGPGPVWSPGPTSSFTPAAPQGPGGAAEVEALEAELHPGAPTLGVANPWAAPTFEERAAAFFGPNWRRRLSESLFPEAFEKIFGPPFSSERAAAFFGPNWRTAPSEECLEYYRSGHDVY